MAAISVIVNPTKFSDLEGAHDALDRLFAKLGVDEYDWVLTTVEDTGAGQAKEVVGNGAEIVLSWGGDGTVRAVAHGLLGTDVPLGILPGGTGNLIAKNLGLPTTLSGALEVALRGRKQVLDVNSVDLGDGARHISLLICGMGLDAAVVDSPEPLKALLGSAAYLATAATKVVGLAKPLSIEVDDEPPRKVAARMVLVGNFGGMQMGIDPFWDADATDGELAIFVAKLRDIIDFVAAGSGTLLQQEATGRHRLQLSGKRVILRTEQDWPREIDGDVVEPGDYMAVEVMPGALTVCVK